MIRTLFKKKPVSITNIATARKFEITFKEHSSSYDFYNFKDLTDKFLLNVKNRIERCFVDVFIRCGFSLENIQSGLTDDNQPLKNSRCWLTEAIQTKTFNDFDFFQYKCINFKRGNK